VIDPGFDPTLPRCSWAGAGALRPDASMVRYHDEEWGTPCHDDRELFERLALESFQAGLSWSTILHKRDAFRIAFSGFDPAIVARFDDADRSRLMADAGIVRNRAKIDATIANARAVADLDVDLSELLWSFAPEPRPRYASMSVVPAVTPESTAMAKELKRRGFKFVGPTTAYALMQATGMVDDHVASCWVPSVLRGD
jgi:DNA-3-methyladenine glycosylase I